MFDEMKKPPGEKISVCMHPEGWQAWIDPGGVPFIRSCFIFCLEIKVMEG
jgi:hypothetical protein